MNYIAAIILTAIVAEYVLHIIADYLNLKMLSDELPDQFIGYYDRERYKKSQDYLRVSARFGWIASTFNLALIIAFWFGRGFPLLDRFVRSFEMGQLLTGLMYIGILILLKGILSLPFGIYSTFVIEERFGFNKTDFKTFIMDIIKGIFVGVLLGVPLISGILLFFEYAGNNAWFYCWVVSAVFMLAVQYIVPVWIMPLFNKFEPLENSELKEAILSYAESINFSLGNIYKMDGSKRSNRSNAFFTGFGKNRRIVLFDTLIENHTVPELLAVIAHETGHYKKKHILKGMFAGILQMGVMFFILSFFISNPELFKAFYMEHISVYAGLVFFGMLYSPVGFFMEIIMQVFSRRNEFEADRFAVDTTGKPEEMAKALKKLSVDNLSNLLPHPFYVFLNYSHPPVLERIEAINKRAVR